MLEVFVFNFNTTIIIYWINMASKSLEIGEEDLNDARNAILGVVEYFRSLVYFCINHVFMSCVVQEIYALHHSNNAELTHGRTII